ncbi:hypothetical protein [Methylopila sp. M107]|uniref:hypothetical protein n=1 Tax=Methylopila sp. M107 TaxID=1101190 RepID=UPI0003808397|nr:hypothetical protein [Methylopila sp. M107]
MAETPAKTLKFDAGCPDCGERLVTLPPALPVIPDDFDWIARDYDSFRLLMMEELAYRFPERRRWTPADMEAVIVELLASGLDRASHALDAIQGERFLETARRPQSVRRLLKLIGYDATIRIDPDILAAVPDDPADAALPAEARAGRKVERYWRDNPAAMNEARTLGPTLVREQRRMVSLADHETLIEAHPLLERVRARLIWTGAWSTILASVMLADGLKLDEALLVGKPAPAHSIDAITFADVVQFHQDYALPEPVEGQTIRAMLQALIEIYRMAGSEVLLEAAKEVPIVFSLSVRARPQYFQSELKTALIEVLSADSGGLFETGRLGFGDEVFASDIIEAAMLVEGVETACLNRLKRLGAKYADHSGDFIPIADDEIAVCFNRRSQPERGSFRVVVNGGAIG